MIEAALIHSWVTLLGSLAMIAIVLTAFGLMVGILKPAEAVDRIGAILGIMIVFILIPVLLISAWVGLPLWQKIAVVAVGICVRLWLRPRHAQRGDSRG